MSYNDVQIKYNGLHPSDATQNYIESLLEEIHRESPYGSQVKATFSAKDHVVKGMVQVNSHAGPFFTVASGDDLKEVTYKLLQQIRRRLSKSKAKRFERESLKHMQERTSDSNVA